MNFKKYKPLLSLLLFIGLTYLSHKIIFYVFGINVTNFHYSLEKLYLIFLAFSFLLGILLIQVKEKSFDNVGMVFLLATSIKMIGCYIIARPILQTASQKHSLEEINFFVLFLLFLTIETTITVRLINEKR